MFSTKLKDRIKQMGLEEENINDSNLKALKHYSITHRMRRSLMEGSHTSLASVLFVIARVQDKRQDHDESSLTHKLCLNLLWKHKKERKRNRKIIIRVDTLGFMHNTPHSAISMLATTSIGTIWSSGSPDFGIDGALDRFEQIEPKVLFACNGSFHNNEQIDVCDKVKYVEQRLKDSSNCVIAFDCTDRINAS